MIVTIIAGGLIEEDFIKAFVDNLNTDDLYVIACDRGYEACKRMGIRVNLVIGDFDSAKEASLEEIKSAGIKVKVLNPIKDDTDTEAALRIAIDRTRPGDEIYLLGATGIRLDHMLGNLNLIGLGLKNNREVVIMDSHNQIQMIGAGDTYEVTAEGQFGQYISVFPYMGKVKGLTMQGFKYPLENADIEGFNTLTVSNELKEEKGLISVKSGYLIVMETRD